MLKSILEAWNSYFSIVILLRSIIWPYTWLIALNNLVRYVHSGLFLLSVMGTILRGCHNNDIGRSFCCLNLIHTYFSYIFDYFSYQVNSRSLLSKDFVVLETYQHFLGMKNSLKLSDPMLYISNCFTIPPRMLQKKFETQSLSQSMTRGWCPY